MADEPSKEEVRDAHAQKAQEILAEMKKQSDRGVKPHIHMLERHDEDREGR